MKKFFDKPWFYRIIALILAILLAVYVASNQQGYVTQGRREETLKTATKTQVIKAPLQVSVNTDKYYVTGYPEKVNLTLEGSNALVISTINTQNFRVYIDLSHLKTGEHTVPIKVNGLSSQLTYNISPSKVRVSIQGYPRRGSLPFNQKQTLCPLGFSKGSYRNRRKQKTNGLFR